MVKISTNYIKINNTFKRVLLFLYLFSFVYADIEWLLYQEKKGFVQYEHKSGEKERTIGIEFDNNDNKPNYIKILLTPKNGIPTPLLCFSPTSEVCQRKRQILEKRTDGLPLMINLKKEQFEDDYLYIFVLCQEEKCQYTLSFNGTQIAEIDANSVFSYLVTEQNQEMKFQAIGEAENGNYLTIGVEGSSTAQINIDGNSNYEQYKFDYGKILTLPINNPNNKNLVTFSIKSAGVGEYLTINVHVVNNNKTKENLLYPNGPVVMGMLSGKDGYFKEECFPISSFSSEKYSNVTKFYLTGNIYSKYGLFYLLDENNNRLEETEKEISDGFLTFVIETTAKKRSVCFGFSQKTSFKMDYVAYSISILQQTNLEKFYRYNPPQTVGQIYRKIIPKGSYEVYNPGTVSIEDKRYNFNLYNIKGVAEMYVAGCKKYPNCIYTIEEIKKLTNPKRINRMTIWESKINELSFDLTYGALDIAKNLMVVYCKDDGNENNGYCEFETSVYTTRKNISLVKNNQFSKYVLKNDTGIIKIDINEGMNIQLLTIDIMIYSGDVNFNVKDNNRKYGEENRYYKYYISNKIFFKFNFAQLANDVIEIEYNALLNSFFTIKYEIYPYDLIQLKESILSDENYLVQIDPTTSEKYKTIYISNYRKKKEKPFLVNFFPLNCDFQLTRKENSNKEKEINFIDGYAQEILLSDNDIYNSENYEYKIKIIEEDLSNYNNKMCMLYVSGYESIDNDFQTEIVVAENINQQIIFNNNLKSVRFLYPQADPEKDLVIYINIIDQAYYNIKIFSNTEEKPFKEYSITRSKIYYIVGEEIKKHCEKDSLCSIIIEASLTKKIDNTHLDEMIEITFRQINSTPFYLQKKMAKKYFISGNETYYLYTEIGKNEIGSVSLNFLRDYGKIWGKIVKINQNEEKNSNWRGIYRMPSKEEEKSLLYNEYTKTLEFGIEDTKDCIEGCYLLLSIQASIRNIDNIDKSYFYPFSIISKINNDAYIPIIGIKVNEYIIGNVNITENEKIYQLYEVWLHHDADRVDFNFLSEIVGLYINLGEERPTIKNNDFKFLPSKDSIFSLDKKEILEKANSKNIKLPYENSLKDLSLIIGVWTNKTDSLETELYSLSVILAINNEDSLDIIEVNTDQKIICKPKKFNNTFFNCLFMIVYEDGDVKQGKPLLIHSRSANQSSLTYTYGKYIDREYYDNYDIDNLKKLIPNSGDSEFNTQRDYNNYICATLSLDKSLKKYFYVNIISDTNDDIYLLSSMAILNITEEEYYPNPNTEQLLSILGEKLNLKFFTNSSILVNIISLGGEAEIKWADSPNNTYNLRGKGEGLSLTTGNNSGELIIERKNNSLNTLRKLSSLDESGFVFYISYYIRNPEINYDKIDYEKSVEIGYKKTDLPIYLYSKIGERNNDINVAITFKDYDINKDGEYSDSPLIIRSSFVKENTVYLAKKFPDLQPLLEKLAHERYDPILKTIQIFISKDYINYFGPENNDNPTLYISIEKKNELMQEEYDKFSIDEEISQANNGIVPIENVYHFGKYDGKEIIYYRLKNNKNYMIIEISFNSDCLDFSINEEINNTNSTNLISNSTKEKGKIILTINASNTIEFIYLNIFKNNESTKNNILLNNYVFKYTNVDKEEDFLTSKILEDNETLEIKTEEKENNKTLIECTFNKIDIKDNKSNITYFFKVISNKQYYKGESYESISIMESPYYAVYKTNPSDSNGVIKLNATINNTHISYLQVIALIQEKNNLEYISYQGANYTNDNITDEEGSEEEKEKEEEEKEEKKDDKGHDFDIGGRDWNFNFNFDFFLDLGFSLDISISLYFLMTFVIILGIILLILVIVILCCCCFFGVCSCCKCCKLFSCFCKCCKCCKFCVVKVYRIIDCQIKNKEIREQIKKYEKEIKELEKKEKLGKEEGEKEKLIEKDNKKENLTELDIMN